MRFPAGRGTFSTPYTGGKRSHPPSGSRTAAAHAHKLRVVLHLREAVVRGHGARPVVEAAVLDALHPAADAAGEVMVMAGAADQESHLAVVTPQGVGGALVGQALEIAVDGCEAHALELAVELLRGHRAVGGAERLEDRLALFGSAAHGTQTIINLNYDPVRALSNRPRRSAVHAHRRRRADAARDRRRPARSLGRAPAAGLLRACR